MTPIGVNRLWSETIVLFLFGVPTGDIEDSSKREFGTHSTLNTSSRSLYRRILEKLHPFISVCIVSNSCYAGRWICSNSSRSSILAVDHETRSLSSENLGMDVAVNAHTSKYLHSNNLDISNLGLCFHVH